MLLIEQELLKLSLIEHETFPFLKHKNAPESFSVKVLGYGESQYGLYIKAELVCDDKKLNGEKRQIGLSSDSVTWLIHEIEVNHLKDLVGTGLTFCKNAKGYLVVDGTVAWGDSDAKEA